MWKVRSRIYRWYGELRIVEQAVEQAVDEVAAPQRAQVYALQLQRLNAIEERVNQISIPLSFATELYGLRSHINFVRNRVLALMRPVPPQDDAADATAASVIAVPTS